MRNKYSFITCVVVLAVGSFRNIFSTSHTYFAHFSFSADLSVCVWGAIFASIDVCQREQAFITYLCTIAHFLPVSYQATVDKTNGIFYAPPSDIRFNLIHIMCNVFESVESLRMRDDDDIDALHIILRRRGKLFHNFSCRCLCVRSIFHLQCKFA